ncbi:MAG: hypothetical protein EA349_08300 [Halomonadaceae bacterium]|nr:MAG: hypothetical protein EA349_08300 [Halomonadaceae bacterium]
MLFFLFAGLLTGCFSSSSCSSCKEPPASPPFDATAPAFPLAPEQLILSSFLDPLVLADNQISQLTATGIDELGQEQPLNDTVTWSSSAPESLSVSSDGQIRGLSPGEDIVVTATLTTPEGTLSDSLTFAVTAATLTSLQLEDAQGQPVSADQHVSLNQGDSLSFRAIATFSDGTREVTRDTQWQSSDDDQVLVGNGNAMAGHAFAIGPGEQVTVSGNFGGHTVNSLIDVLPDPTKTAFIELRMVPDVILSDGTDSATLTARPVPFGPEADLPAGTGFSFTRLSGEALLSTVQEDTTSINGTVQTSISSQQQGLNNIQVDALNSFARGRQNLLVVDSFSQIIRTWVVADAANDNFSFLLGLNNPSNREFLVTRFQLFDQQSQQPLQNVTFGQGQPLKGDSNILFPITLNGPLPAQGLLNRVSLREPNTGAEFTLERVITH